MAGNNVIDIGWKFKGDASGFQKVVGQVLGDITKLGKVIGLNQALELGKKGWEAYAKVMNSTEGTAETLEQQISYLDGAMSGLVRTIATGSWETLISNILKTADATREAKIATQELEHMVAGGSIKRGELELGFQEARTSAAEATDPKEKAKYLQQAIDLRRELTAVEVEEIRKRLQIDEDYYQKLTGHNKTYYEYFLKQVPKLAKEYEYFFGKDSVVAQTTIQRLNDLNYLSSLGPLTKAQEAEKSELNNLRMVMEDYLKVQDDLSAKGQWDNYIRGIGEMSFAAASGEKALNRLIRQLEGLGLKGKDETWKGIEKIAMSGNPNINTKTLADNWGTSKSPYAKDWDFGSPEKVDELANLTNGLVRQEDAVNSLANAFDKLFAGQKGAFKDMIDSIIRDIGRLLSEILAKKVVTAFISLLGNYVSGGSGGLLKGLFSGASNLTSYNSSGISGSALNFNVNGRVYGADILISSERASFSKQRST